MKLKNRESKKNGDSIFSNRLIYATQLNCTEIQMQKMYKDDKKNINTSRLHELGSIREDHRMMSDNPNH